MGGSCHYATAATMPPGAGRATRAMPRGGSGSHGGEIEDGVGRRKGKEKKREDSRNNVIRGTHTERENR